MPKKSKKLTAADVIQIIKDNDLTGFISLHEVNKDTIKVFGHVNGFQDNLSESISEMFIQNPSIFPILIEVGFNIFFKDSAKIKADKSGFDQFMSDMKEFMGQL